MMNSKRFLLPSSLFILFLSFSFSSAHNKPQDNPPLPSPPASSPAQDIPPLPSAPASSPTNGVSTSNTPTVVSPTPSNGGSIESNVSDFKGCFSKVFAFGDSFTDTGNAAMLSGLKSFVNALKSHSSYNSTTKLPGQRLSNGKLVIDFLCETLDLPHLSAYKDKAGNFSTGANFAIAGSTSLPPDYFATHKINHSLMWKPIPESFQTQIDWFNKFLSTVGCHGKNESECKSEMGNTLFWMGEMGGNDYARIFGSTVPVKWLTEMAVGHVCKTLKALLDRGAKYIIVQGLPPAGCCPLELALSKTKDRDSMGCSPSANNVITAHNELLKKRLTELRKQYSNCTISYADTWNAYRDILTNYKKYQFVEPYKACCGSGGGLFNFNLTSLCGAMGSSTCKNPQQFINWDGVHLTESMHKCMADLFFHQGYMNPPFEQLVKAKKGLHTAQAPVN